MIAPVFTFSVGGKDLQRVNQYHFYYLGVALHPLTKVAAGMKIKDIFSDLYGAKGAIDFLLDYTLIPVVTCRAAALRVRDAVRSSIAFMDNKGADWTAELEKEIDPVQAYNITNGIQSLETVFGAEAETWDTYFVSRKAIYSTSHLVDHAEEMFSAAVRKHLPSETISDIRQSGKCIAFDVPTAAGFHILRATESVIRQYYKVVTRKELPKRIRNWALYIDRLGKAGADPKILAVLDQIRENHRNPIMHPEVVLSEDEALSLLGIAQSAMVAMASDMEKRIPTVGGS